MTQKTGYAILILPRASRELGQIETRDYEKVRKAILDLSENPRPPGCAKLKDREGWRIRQGDYRVIYEIDDKQRQVTILDVLHRREAYR